MPAAHGALVVTLKIISDDSWDSVPVRTKLSNLKPRLLGSESHSFVSLKIFEGKEGGEYVSFLITLEFLKIRILSSLGGPLPSFERVLIS